MPGSVVAAVSVLALLLLGTEAVLDRPLGSPGIVGLELARTPERAAAIVEPWTEEARVFAAFGLGLDFAFAVAYAGAIALAASALGARRSGRTWRRVARATVMAAVAAGTFDILENLALARMILHGAYRPWATAATACAVPKFALVALALAGLVCLLGGSRTRSGPLRRSGVRRM